MATAFPDAPAWPGKEPERDQRYDNQPPLEERVVMEFEDQLRDDKLTARIAEITESAKRVPEITGQDIAGKVGDLIAMARTCRKEVENRREAHNRPLLNAQRALKGRQDSLLGPMEDALSAVKRRLDAFMAEERRKADEARRAAEEAARKAQQAIREAEVDDRYIEPIAPASVPEPVARGDLGARVGTRTIWHHERTVPVAKLPKQILENEKVLAAIDQVIGAAIRSGTREIKGVRIWSEQVADVR